MVIIGFNPKDTKLALVQWDSHHLVSELGSRFGIVMEVYYTKCLIEGYPCLVAYNYEATTML